MLGFDYTIIHKKGSENRAADALSRQQEVESSCAAVTIIQPEWMKEVIVSLEGDKEAEKLINQLSIDKSSSPPFSLDNGLLRHNQRIYVGRNGNLKTRIIEQLHSIGLGGHSRITGTYRRVSLYFYWPNIRTDIQSYVQQCDICQKHKTENVATPGLLQQLPIPNGAWQDISMDFITGLPKSEGYTIIWVIVDRFTKFGHFIPLQHLIEAKILAQLFLDNIAKLHGIPQTIVSDRDPLFLSQFWRELFKLLGTQLNFSTSYHP